jgi:signal transduction histidine kinase
MNDGQKDPQGRLRRLRRLPVSLARQAWSRGWARWGDLGVFWVALVLGVFTMVHGGRRLEPTARLGLVILLLVPWLARVFWPRLPGLPLAIGVVVLATWLVVLDDDAFAFFFLPLLVGNTTATEGVGAGIAAALAAAAAPLSFQLLYGGFPEWVYWSVPTLAAPVVGGLIGRLDQLARDLEAAQGALVEQSVAEERRRIAREMHDVIAHTLSVTLLNLTAARRALGDEHPEATEALRTAEELGRQSLGDLRRTVGLLGEALEAGSAAPMPSATDLPTLVEAYRSAGMQLRAVVDGDLSRVPSATGLELYRIAQEALANVVKHGSGAPADLRVRVEADEIVLVLTNAARNGNLAQSGSGGSGIAGMRERAELVSGNLSAGPVASGWAVECRLPATPADPATTP